MPSSVSGVFSILKSTDIVVDSRTCKSAVPDGLQSRGRKIFIILPLYSIWHSLHREYFSSSISAGRAHSWDQVRPGAAKPHRIGWASGFDGDAPVARKRGDGYSALCELPERHLRFLFLFFVFFLSCRSLGTRYAVSACCSTEAIESSQQRNVAIRKLCANSHSVPSLSAISCKDLEAKRNVLPQYFLSGRWKLWSEVYSIYKLAGTAVADVVEHHSLQWATRNKLCHRSDFAIRKSLIYSISAPGFRRLWRRFASTTNLFCSRLFGSNTTHLP